MSDFTSPLELASPGEFGAEAVNADAHLIEAILADFRAWLQEAGELAPLEPVPSLDVATVLQHFIALRQEVNLQTKATRAQQEQGAEAIGLLQEALGEIERRQPDDTAVQEELLRPLLKTLIDAHDALSLAEREVRRLLDNPPALPDPPTPPLAKGGVAPAPPQIKLRIPHWARWLGLDVSIEAQLAPLRAWCAAQSGQPATPAGPDESATRLEQILDALLVGYSMSLQRLERAMEQQGLEAIACVGEPFDPETMEVAEVVRDEGRAGTVVLDEIRKGYRWHGRVFRYAQVRVAKP
jgi:molecular chaperone GrpE